MYHMTVEAIPKEWQDRTFPLKPPPGCHLHSFAVSGEKIICVWEQVGAIPDDWGGRVSVSIPELSRAGAEPV